MTKKEDGVKKKITARLLSGQSQRVIAREFGVSLGFVNKIAKSIPSATVAEKKEKRSEVSREFRDEVIERISAMTMKEADVKAMFMAFVGKTLAKSIDDDRARAMVICELIKMFGRENPNV